MEMVQRDGFQVNRILDLLVIKDQQELSQVGLLVLLDQKDLLDLVTLMEVKARLEEMDRKVQLDLSVLLGQLEYVDPLE
jgi:hypothetical protein